MPTGAITEQIDVAQVVLYAFWIFFFGLVIYLRREDRREGYPLIADTGQDEAPSFVGIPPAKHLHLADGRIVAVPDLDRADTRPVNARPTAPWPGSPYEPSGNPMLAAVGPGSYALREDLADLMINGVPKLAPLRVANDYYLEERDPDPRGMTVIGADGAAAGVVRDVWVDRSEFLVRYLEIELNETTSRPRLATVEGEDAEVSALTANTVLVPMQLVKIDSRKQIVTVESILGSQFIDVPRTKDPNQVTLLEEDMITAYYGGGKLYATPSRKEPAL